MVACAPGAVATRLSATMLGRAAPAGAGLGGVGGGGRTGAAAAGAGGGKAPAELRAPPRWTSRADVTIPAISTSAPTCTRRSRVHPEAAEPAAIGVRQRGAASATIG